MAIIEIRSNMKKILAFAGKVQTDLLFDAVLFISGSKSHVDRFDVSINPYFGIDSANGGFFYSEKFRKAVQTCQRVMLVCLHRCKRSVNGGFGRRERFGE